MNESLVKYEEFVKARDQRNQLEVGVNVVVEESIF